MTADTPSLTPGGVASSRLVRECGDALALAKQIGFQVGGYSRTGPSEALQLFRELNDGMQFVLIMGQYPKYVATAGGSTTCGIVLPPGAELPGDFGLRGEPLEVIQQLAELKGAT